MARSAGGVFLFFATKKATKKVAISIPAGFGRSYYRNISAKWTLYMVQRKRSQSPPDSAGLTTPMTREFLKYIGSRVSIPAGFGRSYYKANAKLI